VLFAQVSPDTAPVPQIQGLSPLLQFVLTVLTMLIPLGMAALRAWKDRQALDSVIRGAEKGATDGAKAAAKIAERVADGERIAPADAAAVVEQAFKTGIQKVAVLEGNEEHLAPRVEKVTTALDKDELERRLAAEKEKP